MAGSLVADLIPSSLAVRVGGGSYIPEFCSLRADDCLGGSRLDCLKLGGRCSPSAFLARGCRGDGERRRLPASFQLWPLHAAQSSFETEVSREPNTPCDNCKGKGWLLCEFCEGQKINVQSRNNRIYRRCPNCRAAGVVICPRCKVFRCVSFPDESDGMVAP